MDRKQQQDVALPICYLFHLAHGREDIPPKHSLAESGTCAQCWAATLNQLVDAEMNARLVRVRALMKLGYAQN